MADCLNSAIVRIHTLDGQIAGMGFLIDRRQVLTCAHVVASGLGVPAYTQETSIKSVLLDFPLIKPEHALNAHVTLWDVEGDVARLELMDAPPAEARLVQLVTANDLWGHAFRAFGFPAGYEDGVWTSGVLRDRISGGWVQIEDVKEPGYWVQPGFSGTAIWDEQLDGVVGMTVAADTDRVTKAAFMIPAQALIEAWPELAAHSLEAGSLEHLHLQLARLEEAQRKAVDPGRFQPQIDALKERIATWDRRVERQRERIAEGLEEQRQQMVEEHAWRREEERLRVVGQPPLDVADYFKDRHRDLEKLGELLTEPTTRLVSVIGHGGMGKTALACKVLRNLERHRWPYTEDEMPVDGIVYLSTRTAGISLERLFLDCARLLGSEEQERLKTVWTNPQLEIPEKIARLLDALRYGRYVILLDNLEDLLDDRGRLIDDGLRLFFEQGLMTSQGTKLVVTSRVALAFRCEVMRFDCQVKLLEGLPVDDGVGLLRELDPNGDYGLRNAPQEQLAEAVELTHGVPRALEVMTGILANDPFATLDEVLETFYEKEDVVQALIEENYKRLDRDARRVIEALAVFRRPVPPLAVDYLLEPFASGLDVPSVVRRLTRTNIVSVDRAAKTVTLHPIDQDYAYSQLPEEDETEADYTRQALDRRAADYYLQLRTPEEAWESIDDLEPQLNEFEHRLHAGDYDDAFRVLSAIDFDYLYLWGHYSRLVEMRERLRARLGDSGLQAHNLSDLGRAYHYLGWDERTVELYEEALAIARETDHRALEADILGHLGLAYGALGQFHRAIELYEEALAVNRENDNREGEGINLGRLGIAYRSLGQFERAVDFFERALKIARQEHDRWNESFWLGQLGRAYRILDQVEEAIAFHKEALAISREIGDRRGEGIQIGSLGAAHLALGRIRHAIQCYEEAWAIASHIQHRRREGVWLGKLGNAYHILGQTQRAIQYYKRALTIARDINQRWRESIWLGKLGSAYHFSGQLEQAIEFHQAALIVAHEIDDRRGKSYQLLRSGITLLAMGQITKACQSLVESMGLNVSVTHHRAALALGIVLLHQSNSAAQGMFAEAIDHCWTKLDKTTDLYEARYTLAAALVGQAICDPNWTDETKRLDLLAPALKQYRRALEVIATPGVVQEAIRDLELIQAAGIKGLEPVFDLLENAECESDEEFRDILGQLDSGNV